MSKYHNTADIAQLREVNPTCSISQLLSFIQPKSRVLDCGCADGALVRYIKEKLKCITSIVEIDEENFNLAKKYTDDSFLGSLESEEWYNYYKTQKFDFIIFSEVLEHLKKPAKVLELARELLTKDGKIIFTIPNICHNDVLIQMFYNNFNYTNIGLLDDEHIHFWGLNDIEPFCRSAGLKILNLQVSRFPTGTTEQARLIDTIDSDLIKLLLDKRENGTVYQFIVVCTK